MTPEELKKRLHAFGLRIVKLASALPHGRIGGVFTRQLVRCGTSVAANYRAACRGRSRSEFVAKLGIVEEEADETLFWIETACDSGLVKRPLVEPLHAEGKEILAIVVASRKTAKRPKPVEP